MPADGGEAKVSGKWYLRPIAVYIAILAAGPFAIPLVWMSPSLKKWHKVLITAVVAGFTIWAMAASAKLYQSAVKQLEELQKVL